MQQLPNNLSAEAALIGSVMYDNRAFYRVRDVVSAPFFYAPAHEEIWTVLSDIIDGGGVADGVTLRERFETSERLVKIGGGEYLGQLYNSACFGPEIVDYARIIADCHMRRSLMVAGQKLTLSSATDDGAESLDAHEAELEIIRDHRPNKVEIQSAAELADFAMQEDETFSLLSTGLPTIDQELGGFERGALSVIAARPGVGKSALAVCMMGHIAQNESVGFISLDMTGRVVLQRLGCYCAWMQGHRVPLVSDLRKRHAKPEQRDMLSAALKQSVGERVFVDDRARLSVADINLQIREWKRNCRRFGLPKLGAVFIDHIGKVYPKQSSGSLYEKTSYASNELLEIAKQHEDVSLIALAQLNRENAKGKRRPNISDLRDSGKIEEDASAVLLLHREDLYLALEAKNEALDEEERARAQRDMLKHKGQFEVIIGKNRNGEPGAVLMGHSIGHNVIRDPIIMNQRRVA